MLLLDSHSEATFLESNFCRNDQPCPLSSSYSPFSYSLPPLLRSRVEMEGTLKSKVLTARVVPTPTRHSTYVKRTTTATPLKLRDQGVLRALLTSAWTPAVKQKIPRTASVTVRTPYVRPALLLRDDFAIRTIRTGKTNMRA